MVAIYFYRRNKKLKQRLDYEVTDIRNMASPDRTNEEISQITTNKNASKYTNLSNDRSQI